MLLVIVPGSPASSYGVLKELSETELGREGHMYRLSDEVDVITSVSGGSFTAAYFGLYGDRIFEDYEQDFLRRNVQGELTGQVLNPFNWPRLLSPFYTRADMASELYDGTLFHHATFADMIKAHGPYVIINATEMTLGTRYQFTQDYADIICSDLSRLPVSRAVTASSAVPILFSPITLTNHAGDCDWQQPAWMRDALDTRNRSSRLYKLATGMLALENVEDHPYGFEIVALMKDRLAEWQRESYEATWGTAALPGKDTGGKTAGSQCKGVDFHFIEVNFSEHPNPEERDYLKRLPTSFVLTDEAVDRLIAAGRLVLRYNSEYQRLLSEAGH